MRGLCRALLILAVVDLPLITHAQTPNFAGQNVVRVEFTPADQPLAPQDMERVQHVRPGQPYDADAIAESIDQLFATGRYTDIQAQVEPTPGGIIVRYVTTLQWFNGGVTAQGKISNPPSRGQVINTVGLPLGTPFHEEDLRAAEERLLRAFESNGLYEADIKPDMERDPQGNQIRFTFNVRAGKRAKYAVPVIKGDTKLSDSAIIGATGWRYRIIHIYKKVNAQRTRAGVVGLQKKYQSKDRLMAKIDIESLDYDPKTRRVRPTLNIDAGPKVDVRAVEAKVSDRVLRQQVPIYEERRVDRDLLVEGARNLRDYFQSRGYYDVSVDFREREEVADQRIIEYVIAQGQRYKVVKVEIAGNTYFPLETIEERLFVRAAGFIALRRGRYSESMRSKDEENIANLYQSNGFRDVRVTSTVDRNYQNHPDQIAVTYQIEEGPQWFVDDLTVTGTKAMTDGDVRSRIASAAGQPFSASNVATDRNVILTEYFSRGFPAANFKWTFTPSDRENHVNLTYNIEEGERQYVREVVVSGLQHTRYGLVDRNIHVEPGEPLSTLQMLQSQRSLYELGIFSRVNAAIQNPDGQTTHKYVLYDIEEANRYNVSVGFGAEFARFGGTTTTLSSPGGATGFSPRLSLDVSRLNFLGLGHTVSFRGRASNLQNRASINYIAPRFRNREGRNITFTALIDNSRDVRTFASRRQEASVQMSQQVSRATTALLRFSYRRVNISDVVIPTLLVPALLQPVRIGMLSANLAHDRRDNPVDATRGMFSTIDFGTAWRGFGSQRSFLRTLGRNASYHRINRDLVFARQTSVGLVFPFRTPTGLTESEAIPLPERFFGGGSTSHRGFPDNQAGPRDIGTPAGSGAEATQPTGFPLGGNALLFNNLELRFPLLGENIRGVIFHDAGNIFSRIGNISFRQRQRNDQDFDYMVHAAGFGIRYKTPVGPVRVDLVYSINPPNYVGFKGSIQDLLACGPASAAGNPACQGVRQSTGHFQFFFSIGQTF